MRMFLITILILAVASKETKNEDEVLTEKDACAVNFFKVPTRQRVIITQSVSFTNHKPWGGALLQIAKSKNHF